VTSGLDKLAGAIIFLVAVVIFVIVLFALLDWIYPVSGQLPDPGPILPQIPRDRIPCQTMNEYDFSPYRCYEV
jgi:hypothetical protein